MNFGQDAVQPTTGINPTASPGTRGTGEAQRRLEPLLSLELEQG